MSVMNLLPTEEKENFNSYRFMYAGDEVDSYNAAPVDEILAPWVDGKDFFLHKIFKDTLIHEKEFEYKRPLPELVASFDEARGNAYSPIGSFIVAFKNAVRNYYSINEIQIDDEAYVQPPYWVINSLLDSNILARNKANVDYTFTCGDKTIHIQPESKPVKILGKIVDGIGFARETFEQFRLAHSQILNQKKLKGTLCLSIHPLDYATMSDNDYGWTSCMSWINNGEYRRGTVEMMTSDVAIVAYIKGKDMRFGSFTWNSKKWRSLVLAAPSSITSVKGYPYQNPDFSIAAIDFLKELIEKYTDYRYYDNYIEFEGSCLEVDLQNDSKFPDINGVELNFETDAMYNDFGTCVSYCYIGKSARYDSNTKKIDIDINYSGPAVCMKCGNTNVYFDSDYCNTLVCDSCGSHPIGCCECCGREIWDEDDDYIITPDGSYCCSYCYDEGFVRRDCISDEFEYTDNMHEILVYDRDEKVLYKIYTEFSNANSRYSDRWNKTFTFSDIEDCYVDEDDPQYEDNYYADSYVISIDQLLDRIILEDMDYYDRITMLPEDKIKDLEAIICNK